MFGFLGSTWCLCDSSMLLLKQPDADPQELDKQIGPSRTMEPAQQ